MVCFPPFWAAVDQMTFPIFFLSDPPDQASVPTSFSSQRKTSCDMLGEEGHQNVLAITVSSFGNRFLRNWEFFQLPSHLTFREENIVDVEIGRALFVR